MLLNPHVPDGIYSLDLGGRPFYLSCPECGEIYLRGVAIVVIRFAGNEAIIGQGEEESHDCPCCKKTIRDGIREGGIRLMAVFASVDLAQKKAVDLLSRFNADQKAFAKDIVLCDGRGP